MNNLLLLVCSILFLFQAALLQVATAVVTITTNTNKPCHVNALQSNMPVTLRLATTKDVPGVLALQLEDIGYKFDGDWFNQHIEVWPSLAIVAESNDGETLLGYAIGRVEGTRQKHGTRNVLTSKPWRDCVPLGISEATAEAVVVRKKMATRGHVAVIFIKGDRRGQGIGTEMMHLLHTQLLAVYEIGEIGLYCSASNVPALALYSSMRYQQISKCVGYYRKGDPADSDAWLMVRN